MSSFVTIRSVRLLRSLTALGISRYASKDVYCGSIFVLASNFRKPAAKLRTFECESGDAYLSRALSRRAVTVRCEIPPLVDSHNASDARSIQSNDFAASPAFRCDEII